MVASSAASRKKNAADDGINPFINPALIMERSTLEYEVEMSFLTYAYSVITDRALPDARDGLQPVQRRILYSMYESGFGQTKPHQKSAKIVGITTGNYHPHGDSACYGAMVRLAQPFSLYLPLVDGHGNFGDQPGSTYAASRYTEARLAQSSTLLLQELAEDAVEMRSNYDNSTLEPTVLPAMFPNLLVNGASGIAVGMATNMPTHNPNEIMAAARWLLTHPNATLEKLMEFVPGPDFHSGGEIIGVDAIKEGYATGRGIFRIRGRADVEDAGRGKHRIVFYELPYGVSIEKIIEKTKKAIELGKITGVSDIKDLTDRRNGTRLVVETKTGVNPQALMVDLFQYTDLQVSFGINNMALVNGEPKMLGLRDLLSIFLEHRKDATRRRSQFRLAKKENRLHLVKGLLKALADIDKVIEIIRGSDDDEIASKELIKYFKVDEVQAKYILDLQLRRLTRLDQIKLDTESASLQTEIESLNAILNDPEVLTKLIGDELVATAKLLDTPRHSTIIDGDLSVHIAAAKEAAATITAEVEDAPCVVAVYASGLLARGAAEALKVSGRGKIDPIVGVIDTTTRGNFVAVTSAGRGFRVETLHLSESSKTRPGELAITLGRGERIVALGRGEARDGEAGLALGTKNGVVKVSTTDFPLRNNEFPVISLTDGDSVLGGAWVSDAATTDFAFVSSDTSMLRFEASRVRPQGSKGGGMVGIKLDVGATAIGFFVIPEHDKDGAEVITFTGKTLKRSSFILGPVKGRGTGGQRFHMLRAALGEKALTMAFIGVKPLVVDADGKSVTLPVPAKRDGSGTPHEGVIASMGLSG